MLFYSIVVIAWVATALATPPPGYVKKPDNDKDPPAYQYKYEIGDGNGKGQGKSETRSGEFASGSYYVNTGQAATDVKYFVDDWGYHPVVKYGSIDKHGSTATQFALGEHAVKALLSGGDVGPKVKLPGESQKRKPVQIIQPYSIENNDPGKVTPTYPIIENNGRTSATSNVKEGVQDSREHSSNDEDFPKESQESSTILIPSSSHSTTPQEIAYTASTPLSPTPTPTPLTYVPLQEVRDIYANNDYQNAALIDEQLYLQSTSGNFGQKVHAASVGESGIKDYRYSVTTPSPDTNTPVHSLTKQNGDVTYTVHSGSNVNTAYLSSAGKSKKAQRLHNRYQYHQKFVSSLPTESPNYSGNGLSTVTFASTTSAPATVSREYTSNDLVSEKQEKYEYVSLDAKPSQEFTEFGAADPHVVNYGLVSGNERPIEYQGKLETPGLSAYSKENSYVSTKNVNAVQNSELHTFTATSSTSSSGYFGKPIVVADVTPRYDTPDYSTTLNCIDDLVAPTTPTPILSTTSQPIISTDTLIVTPKYESENHITTSAVVLNPIQAGVALVNAGETNLLSDGATKFGAPVREDVSERLSESKSIISGFEESRERNKLNLEERIQQLQKEQREQELREENRIHEEEQLKKVQRLQEELQLQQVQQFQQELQLQQNQYEIQELQLQQQLQLHDIQQQQKLQQVVETGEEKELKQQQQYHYQQLNDHTQLKQEVELQQVEESQQSEQLQAEEIQQVDKKQFEEQLDQKQLLEVHLQQQQNEEINVGQIQEGDNLQAQQYEKINVGQIQEGDNLQAQQYEEHQIQEAIQNEQAQQLQQQQQYELHQQLQKYRQEQEHHKASNSFVGSSESNHDQDIEIQKSIEIYHNEPVREIHYPAQVAAQVESSQIDQSQERQQYIELQSIENTQQAYRGQVQSGAKVSFEINHVPDQGYQLGQKDQFSLGAENQAQQVFVAEHQANLNQPYDLTRSNSLSQQTSTNNGAVLLGFRVNHESGGRHNYQIDQHRGNGAGTHEIDQQSTPHRVIFGTNVASGAYQLNQRDQSHSHSHSHSYESNRGQQQVVVGLPYTLEASKELVLPGIATTTTQIIDNPVFEKQVAVSGSDHYPIESVSGGGDKYAIETSNESVAGGIIEKHIPVIQPYPVEKVIEKTVHVPQPYPVEKKVPFPVEVEKIIEKQVPVHVLRPYPVEVEKVIEKKVPYPVDRIVEKHIPILQPYPVHIKVPQPYPIEKIITKPYPVETIVEKPVHIHVPVEKIIEKQVPVPQPYPVEVEKIVEKKVPYPVEVTKYIDKPVPIHVPQPYPVEKIVERIVEKPVHIRIPYAVEVSRHIPYGVQYGVSYQQIMRPHSQSLYINHGKPRIPFYGLPVITRHQEFRHQENSHVDSKQQFQGYSYDKPAVSFVEGGGNAYDQISAGSQQIQFKHSLHQNLGKKSNSHLTFPHYSARRHTVRVNAKENPRTEEYIGPVPPQRLSQLRHYQHSLQNQHAVQPRSPQSSTAATRSPASTTTLRRLREPETKPQSSTGNFRQSRVEYGFKPPMIPSVQYDEKTATKVES